MRFLAFNNPRSTVYLLLLTKDDYVILPNSDVVKLLQSFKNVNLKVVNLKEFSRNTPIEVFTRKGKLEFSRYHVSHTSDVLRFLTLWKFGGIYLDLDVIVQKPIEFTNFACLEDPETIVPGIMGLDSHHGKEIAELLLKYDEHKYFL